MTSQIDPDVIEIAKSLADTASKIGHKYFRLNPQIEKKIDGSPVTIADLEIERALRQIIRERYPNHGFYGEEEGHDNSDAEWLWVVDPIDGTKSFATGKRTYGCLIALCFQDKPVLGIIDMPALNERWLGVQGNATEYNGTVCHTSLNNNLDMATLNATTPDMFNEAEWHTFSTVGSSVRFRQFGADCYAYGLLASGFTDIVMEAGLGRFDYLALVPIIEGAGGCISDWQGAPLTFGSEGQALASANEALHAEVLGRIQKLSTQ